MKELKLDEKDFSYLKENCLTPEDINSQFNKLFRGNLPVKLVKPATLDDGIISLSNEKRKELCTKFEKLSSDQTFTKFIPASGAATRMFRELNLILCDLRNGNISIDDLTGKIEDKREVIFFQNFYNSLKNREIPFIEALEKAVKKDGSDLPALISKNDFQTILEYILEKKGLNYGSYPKALIKFHKYRDMVVSPVGEHFLEAALFTKGAEKKIAIHFTVPEEFQEEFRRETLLYKELFGKKGYHIEPVLSIQNKKTNNISLNRNNEPARNNNGDILLRPGGHGSLISNINEIKSDIIFIKNIDNITTCEKISDTIENKKVLSSILIDIREKIFGFQKTLPRIIKDGESINEIYCYSKDVLNISFQSDFIELDLEKKKRILAGKLNRPIRVCGMVKNENEPGGGPFWIENVKREITLQIIEGSQIDKNSQDQVEIFRQSSYFNPVNIACSIKDHQGEVFDLNDFVEESRYFISEKFFQGEPIKTIEHPGLWNGSMEKWITLFVEVYLSTFNPVKSVNDLLKTSHQPSEDISFLSLM